MIRYENDCVGCPQGCINCGRRRTPHIYCNVCGDEIDYDSDEWTLDKDYHVCDSCKWEDDI